ncbi:MAG: ribonuclease P protein component [Chloroflexota bacterium]|nr:ribonuclease P protein component [Chloroflexota bacterium]
MALDRSARLHSSQHWRDVRRRGKRSYGAYAVLYCLRGGDTGRVGFSTTKSFRRAVDRNRARRRLRAAFDHVYCPGEEPAMIAIVAKPETLTAEFRDLMTALATQLRELGIQARDPEA